MNKKEWLDYVYYEIGKQQTDFLLCGLKKLLNEEIKATKWKKYSEVCFGLNPWESNKIEWINQRQILPNELVLDIENKEDYNKIITELNTIFKDSLELSYFCYDTGSRGNHIHIFSKYPITKETKDFFCKKFGTDITKIGGKTMIALENTPHWKTGKIKTLILEYGN